MCRWSPRNWLWSWSPGACEVGSSGPLEPLPGPHGNPSHSQLISKEKTEEFLICEEDQEAKLLGWKLRLVHDLQQNWEGSYPPGLSSGNPSENLLVHSLQFRLLCFVQQGPTVEWSQASDSSPAFPWALLAKEVFVHIKEMLLHKHQRPVKHTCIIDHGSGLSCAGLPRPLPKQAGFQDFPASVQAGKGQPHCSAMEPCNQPLNPCESTVCNLPQPSVAPFLDHAFKR